MKDELTVAQRAERSLIKKYRDMIWDPFIGSIKKYELLSPGDKIAVCVSGGKDSMLLCKLMQLLQKHSDFPFDLTFLAMDPGYNADNRSKLEENARLLDVPLTIFETRIFSVAERTEKSPCYLCARMRRGALYAKAKELGCNKIALGHHLNDVIETAVMSMFYGSQLQCMIPKAKSENYEGMELIRPLYRVEEAAVIAWARYNGLSFLRCACRFTENSETGVGESKRQDVKNMIKELKKTSPDIEKVIFSSIHNVCIETFPAYRKNGEIHRFTEDYDK